MALSEQDRITYEALLRRRECFDGMMWQSPVIGLAAQSFLLSIALDPGKGLVPNVLGSLLSICLGFATLQLMSKHRWNEVRCSRALERFEHEHGIEVVHSRADPGLHDENPWLDWLPRLSSYRVWMTSLFLFVVGGCIALVWGLIRVFGSI